MDNKKIGIFLRDLRKEQNLTQEELGEKLGATNKTISRWETGTYLPPVDILLQMSKLYDVSVNEILSGERLAIADYQSNAEENIVTTLQRSQKDSLAKKIAIVCCSVVLAVVLLFAAFYLFLYFLLQFDHRGQFVQGVYEYRGESFLLANGDRLQSIELELEQTDNKTYKQAKAINVIKNGANNRTYKVALFVKTVGGEKQRYNLMFYGSTHADEYSFLVDGENHEIPLALVSIDLRAVKHGIDEYNVVRSMSFYFELRNGSYDDVSDVCWCVNLKLRNDTPDIFDDI